eukprot:1361670-Alexandrium_andersonii.AAC.1
MASSSSMRCGAARSWEVGRFAYGNTEQWFRWRAPPPPTGATIPLYHHGAPPLGTSRTTTFA